MSASINFERIITHITQRESTINNDLLIELSECEITDYASSLKGTFAGLIVAKVNQKIASQDLALVSEGMRSEQWQACSCSEAKRRHMEMNALRIDAHYKSIIEDMQCIAIDERALESLRNHCVAFLELLSERQTAENMQTIKGWADEFVDLISSDKTKKVVKLVEVKA